MKHKTSILAAVQELLAEGPYAGVPTVMKDPVYHVGHLEKKRKVGGTGYEGDGLPVSEHPQAWSSIAKLGGGDLWHLKRRGGHGRFMNIVAAMKNKALKSRVVAWATSSGWATQGQVWQASWYDDEWEDQFTATYGSREELEAEHGDDDGVEIKQASQLVATPKFNDWWRSFTGRDVDEGLVMEMLFYLFARDQTDLDGVWWNDRLDVSKLSAPRGAIFQERLDGWEKRKISWDDGPEENGLDESTKGQVPENLMYHVTLPKYVKSIMQNGLIPSCDARGIKADSFDKRVCFFYDRKTMEDALRNWLLDTERFENQDTVAVLTINVAGLDLFDDPELPGAAVYTSSRVEPRRIVDTENLYVGLDESIR